jgi:hypothetical protein
MMSALAHGIVVTKLVVSEVTTTDNTSLLKPGPWGTNLATIATKAQACRAIAATGSIGDGQKSLE